MRDRVCGNLPASYCNNNEQAYCVFHFPSRHKKTDFQTQLNLRLDNGDGDFTGFYFPHDIIISAAKTSVEFSFMEATFSGNITFMGEFLGALDFRRSVIQKDARLKFYGAVLGGGVDFRDAVIQGSLLFVGNKWESFGTHEIIEQMNYVFEGSRAWLQFENTIVEHPELIVFHTVRLEPSWFVNINCNNFTFIDCIWAYFNYNALTIDEEIDGIYMKNGIFFPPNAPALLTKILRQLSSNYETNDEFEKASYFRRMAMEVEWQCKKDSFYNWISNLDEESDKFKQFVQRQIAGMDDVIDGDSSEIPRPSIVTCSTTCWI